MISLQIGLIATLRNYSGQCEFIAVAANLIGNDRTDSSHHTIASLHSLNIHYPVMILKPLIKRYHQTLEDLQI